MKDLIYSAAALILGIVLGVLSTITALAAFGAYVYVDEGRKKPKRDYGRFKASDIKTPPTPDWRNVVLGTRKEAEDVLDLLRGFIEQYGKVTVAEYLSTVGVESNFADTKWGWKTVVAAQIRPDKDGYLLWLPTPEPV